MTDTADTNPPATLETRWYMDTEGRVMQMSASPGTPVDLPAEWTLLPPEDGARRFAEQQQHAEEMMAKAVAEAADVTAKAEEERGQLLEQFANMMAITVGQAALLLGVPLPGQRPMAEPAVQMMHGSEVPAPSAPADNAGL